MDSDLESFISHLGDDEPFSTNHQMNELWKELEDYVDKELCDIDKFLDEILPTAQLVPPPMDNDFQIIESAGQITTEEFFKSFALPKTIYTDVIADPKMDFKDKNLVPTEMLLKLVQQHASMSSSQNYPNKTLETHMPMPMSSVQRSNELNGEIKNHLNSSQASTDFLTFQNVDDQNVNWYNLLENQQIHPGITVDSVIENIIRNSSFLGQILPARKDIYHTVSVLFTIVNSYIGRLTAGLANNKFFDESEFAMVTRKFQEETISNSNINSNSLLEILAEWMEMVARKFVHINDQRRQIEEKVSKKIIDRAVENYRTRLEALDLNGDISIVHKKQSEIVCEGIRRIYRNCGEQFNATILRELEERLEGVKSSLKKSVNSHQKNVKLKDPGVFFKLLVSEYVSNINQKGLRCAGISTIKQFDDVNMNCLADIRQTFERQANEVPSAQLNDLREQFKLSLEAESNTKRSEFKSKMGSTTSSGIPSFYSPTRSYSVGIHFGFETLTVSYYNQANNSFRIIYGPSINVISFVPRAVFIGEIPEDGCTLNMEQLLTKLNVQERHDTKYHGELRLEEIIALILLQIDQRAKHNLHSSTAIKYAIAIPSCLNAVMQGTFRTAMNIANIQGDLVREQCALTTHFILKDHQINSGNIDEFLITLIENSQNACDSVKYEIDNRNKTIDPIYINGSDEDTSIFSYVIKKPGIHFELDKMKILQHKRSCFLLCSADFMPQEKVKRIRSKFLCSKVHPLKFDSSNFANGAALLSSIANGNKKLERPFNLRRLTSIKPIAGMAKVSYRLKHTGHNVEDKLIAEMSTKLSSLMANQSQEFAKGKAAAKQFLMTKMNDLEVSNLSDHQKQAYHQQLEEDLKAVEKEPMNELVVKGIVEPWKNQFC